jgi:serine/threonine protein kinase
MKDHCPTLDELEMDLLKSLVTMDPNKRISARQAVLHPYFDTLDKSQF